jgi:hypothetical protein
VNWDLREVAEEYSLRQVCTATSCRPSEKLSGLRSRLVLLRSLRLCPLVVHPDFSPPIYSSQWSIRVAPLPYSHFCLGAVVCYPATCSPRRRTSSSLVFPGRLMGVVSVRVARPRTTAAIDGFLTQLFVTLGWRALAPCETADGSKNDLRVVGSVCQKIPYSVRESSTFLLNHNSPFGFLQR